MLDTTNPHNYSYITKELEIHVLGGIKFTNLERMRVTLSIKKLVPAKAGTQSTNVLRHSIR